jgi:hypothetical protein
MQFATAGFDRGSLMPKALCIISLVLALLVVLLFGTDLLLYFVGSREFHFFKGASLLMDGFFTALGGIVAYLAWSTFREQK